MSEIALTLACSLSDRTRPILDGRVKVKGCKLVALPGEPEDIFRRALRDKAFDVTELSMSSHMVTTARGDAPYIGVPVFLSRAFRHSGIFIRTDRGIAAPEDLKGKRIGVPEYQQTAGMWVRGILFEQHGVKPTDVAWRTGGERVKIDLPPEIDVAPVAAGQTLNDLLVAGEIDALIAPRPPACFGDGQTPVARLFPDYRTAEVAYYKATECFPIMHCLAMRKDIAAAHPWLPLELFRAFVQAKALSVGELAMINFLRVSLPWVAMHLEETQAVLGPNPWRYGFRESLHELSAMTRYTAADGLTARQLDPAELFHASTLEEPDKA